VAVVYKASDLHSDMRHVAVKLFAESQAHTWLGAEFFARECRVLQELRHPAVIDLLDWGTDDATGERLLVLEWTDNTLASRRGDSFEGVGLLLRRRRTPDPGGAVVRAWAACLAPEIESPRTSCWDMAGQPKIADFSIAKVDQRWGPSRTVGAFESHPSPRLKTMMARRAAAGLLELRRPRPVLPTEIQFRDYSDIQRALAPVDVLETIEECHDPSCRRPLDLEEVGRCGRMCDCSLRQKGTG
jgi:hypothetical protein